MFYHRLRYLRVVSYRKWIIPCIYVGLIYFNFRLWKVMLLFKNYFWSSDKLILYSFIAHRFKFKGNCLSFLIYYCSPIYSTNWFLIFFMSTVKYIRHCFQVTRILFEFILNPLFYTCSLINNRFNMTSSSFVINLKIVMSTSPKSQY